MTLPARHRQLQSFLAAYVCTDPLELAHRAAMSALLDQAGDPFARDHFTPGHFTASAFVVTADLRQLLLIYHSKLLRWLQPGGHFEPADSDCIAAARREVAEETGLLDLRLAAAPFDLDVHLIPSRKTEPAHLHLDVRCLFTVTERGGTAGSDAAGLRWVELDAVATLESDESVMRAVARLQRLRNS